jgi:hypothetical protein
VDLRVSIAAAAVTCWSISRVIGETYSLHQ